MPRGLAGGVGFCYGPSCFGLRRLHSRYWHSNDAKPIEMAFDVRLSGLSDTAAIADVVAARSAILQDLATISACLDLLLTQKRRFSGTVRTYRRPSDLSAPRIGPPPCQFAGGNLTFGWETLPVRVGKLAPRR